jgi:hypothetical protein
MSATAALVLAAAALLALAVAFTPALRPRRRPHRYSPPTYPQHHTQSVWVGGAVPAVEGAVTLVRVPPEQVAALTPPNVAALTPANAAVPPEALGPSTQPIPVQRAGRHRRDEAGKNSVTATSILRAVRADYAASVDDQLDAAR